MRSTSASLRCCAAALLRKGEAAEPFRLALVDLDRFKPINDRYGHGFGDKLLRAVAGRLRETVGDDGLVVRQGGDEFAVLIPPGSPLMAAPLGERILIALVRPYVIEGVSVQVGAGIGVADWPGHGRDADALFEFADRALYQAKAESRAARGVAVPETVAISA